MRLSSKDSGKRVTGAGLFAGVRKMLLRVQAWVAACLNAQTVGYTYTQWLMLLTLFCLVTGSFCLYLILSAVY